MDKNLELYKREHYTMAEELFNNFKNMKGCVDGIQKLKYDFEDPYMLSEEYKQGFIAGVKIMSAILMDM